MATECKQTFNEFILQTLCIKCIRYFHYRTNRIVPCSESTYLSAFDSSHFKTWMWRCGRLFMDCARLSSSHALF